MIFFCLLRIPITNYSYKMYLPSNMYANANAAMKRAIFDTEEEQRWTRAGTPPSSTIRRAFPGLNARFQRAPAAVS